MSLAISISSLSLNSCSTLLKHAKPNNDFLFKVKTFDKPQGFFSIKKCKKNSNKSYKRLICRAAEYKFPDPIPDFADAETAKFKEHLEKKLSKKKDLFGDDIEDVIGICTEIFATFMFTEYGGPGTLLATPFIDMADTLNERGLPGGPQAARAAVKWAEKHIDMDWKDWTSKK